MAKARYKIEIETLPEIKNNPLDKNAYEDWIRNKHILERFLGEHGVRVHEESFSSGGNMTIYSYITKGIGVYINTKETTDPENRRVDMNIVLASNLLEVDGLAATILLISSDLLRRKQPEVDEVGVAR